MSEHPLEWLPAYHDGELPPTRRQQVENHLQDCAACRAELQMLTGLSALLKTDPVPQRTPPQRFAAQVQLLLPRSAAPRPTTQQLPRWMLGAPLALIVAWAFLQAALWVTAFVLRAGTIFPSMTPWLVSNNDLATLGTLAALTIILTAGAVSLWGAWIALWWAWKHNQNPQPIFNHLEKEV